MSRCMLYLQEVFTPSPQSLCFLPYSGAVFNFSDRQWDSAKDFS